MQRNEILDCVHTDRASVCIVRLTLSLNYAEKLTKDYAAPPESSLTPPHFI